MNPQRAKCKLEPRRGEVAEPGLRRTPGTRVDSKGSRGFESPPLRHGVPASEDSPRSDAKAARLARIGRPKGLGDRAIRHIVAEVGEFSPAASLAGPYRGGPVSVSAARGEYRPLQGI